MTYICKPISGKQFPIDIKRKRAYLFRNLLNFNLFGAEINIDRHKAPICEGCMFGLNSKMNDLNKVNENLKNDIQKWI